MDKNKKKYYISNEKTPRIKSELTEISNSSQANNIKVE